MVWYSYLFQNFPQFIVIHTVKGFGIVNKAEIDVFLELSCFFHDPADVGNLISHANKVMLKILQARLQQYVNRELPNVQAGFRKGRGTRDQIANIHWIIKKARKFQKKSALLTTPKLLTV